MKTLFNLILFICLIGHLQADDALFELGNKAYKEGNYPIAVDSYKGLIQKGYLSAELYYNLANALLKSEKIGEAVLYFEKAYNLKPSNKYIKQNLEIARAKVDTEIIEIPDFFLLRIWKGFSNLFSPTIWMITQLLLMLLAVFGVYLWRLNEEEASRYRGFKIVLSCLLLLFIAYTAGRTSHDLRFGNNHGIVMKATNLKSGPDERSDDLEPLSPGVKAELLEEVDSWYKVTLMNKAIGWLPVNLVETI